MRLAVVLSSFCLALCLTRSAASCSCNSLMSSSAALAAFAASSVRRFSSFTSRLERSRFSFSRSISSRCWVESRSSCVARLRASSASCSRRASKRPPRCSSASSCSSRRSSSSSFFATAACRSSARMAWYSLDSCRMVARCASRAALSSGDTPSPSLASMRASSRRRATSSSAFRTWGVTGDPFVRRSTSNANTLSQDTRAFLATNWKGGLATAAPPPPPPVPAMPAIARQSRRRRRCR
mmetsp:Transcript_30992/g.77108  ORF Transcript_30992/g.77108 Transcript_30992/m.77108 type:complete len:239 (-) Transcript_30992:267-983(-)